MTRRSLLASAALAACGTRRQDRPNILFVIADDMTWPSPGASTPVFDRIAGEGVLFTRSYCASPSCTPSRSAVLTGKHIWQLGEAGVLYGTMPPDQTLFTHRLEDARYSVGFTGKAWAPGDWRAAGLTRHPVGKEFNTRRLDPAPHAAIDPRDYAANFEDFLAAAPAGSPWCFWFGCTEPHRVYEKGSGLRMGKKLDGVTVPPYWPDTPGIRSDLLDYQAEVEWFDSQVGRVVAALEKRSLLNNTLIVVTSDNGMPFPRAKVNLYEPGVHMPLAMRWGSRIKGGRRVEDFVSHVDFAPTLLEAAGLTPHEGMAGRSLMPLLDSAAPDPARDCVYTALERHTMCRPDGATYPIRGLRTARYQYLRNFAPDRWPTGGPEFVSSNLTYHGDVDGCPTKDFMTAPGNQRRFAREYELCFGKRPAEEFYDVNADPHQVRNLAADPAHHAALADHRTRLEAYLRKTGDPRIEGRDPWQAYAYRQTTGFGASFNTALPAEVREAARKRGAHKPE
ncbi:MAG: sulfatase [Acidobacteria bacterium]|nr:sulfatase [Acidobacteriota bacterium]